jgi:hypothetical protein
MAQDRLNSRIIEQLGAKLADADDQEEETDCESRARAARGEATD